MPRGYSSDLRGRVLAAYEAGEGSQARVAERYRVGERTLSGWLRAAREEGRRAPKPRRGGTKPVGGESATLAALVAERNAATLAEYAGLLAERAGVERSPSALCRALKALGLVRKKRRSGPPSRIAPKSPPRGRHGAPIWRGSTPVGSSSSTRPASIPG
jgi:transposase